MQDRQIEAYLVGGIIRDELLGRESHDIDLAVSQGALGLARELANQLGGAYYVLDAERETGRIVMPDRQTIDIALLRGADIDADLAARDFTINAMALPIQKPVFLQSAPEAQRSWAEKTGFSAAVMSALIDPHHGADDLHARTIRAVGDQSFVADPLRLIRAVRLAAELDFTIDVQTQNLIRRDAAWLAQSSGERVRDELVKILAADHSLASLRSLADHHLFSLVLPHAQFNDEPQRLIQQVENLSAWLHSLSGEIEGNRALSHIIRHYGSLLTDRLDFHLSDERSRWIILKLAVLYDASDAIASDLHHLKFSRAEIDLARSLLRHQAQFAQLAVPLDRLAVHRFFRDTAGVGIELIVLALSRAAGSANEARTLAQATDLLQNYTENYQRVIAPTPVLNGAELSERFGLQGPQIGYWLRELIEAQVRGEVRTREDAERYLQSAISH